MPKEIIYCGKCGHSLRVSKISLDTRGKEFSLTISGIPVYACDKCGQSLHYHENGPLPEDIVTAVLNALDKLTPSSYGAPVHTPNQCRECRGNLTNGKVKIAPLQTSEPLRKGIHVLVVGYKGPVVECPTCGIRHPILTPVTCHEINEGVHRDGAIYARNL